VLNKPGKKLCEGEAAPPSALAAVNHESRLPAHGFFLPFSMPAVDLWKQSNNDREKLGSSELHEWTAPCPLSALGFVPPGDVPKA